MVDESRVREDGALVLDVEGPDVADRGEGVEGGVGVGDVEGFLVDA